MKTAQVIVEAGPRARPAFLAALPLHLSPDDLVLAVEVLSDGQAVPSEFAHQQEDGSGGVIFPVGPMTAGESRTFELRTWDAGEQPPDAAPNRITLSDNGSAIDIMIDGKPFTSYHYHSAMVRPTFHPVCTPSGLAVTRYWPMQEGDPGEDRDHPHQRGLWVAHGDVNGVDHWNELEGHGWTAHVSFDGLTGGPLLGQMDAKAVWHGADGVPVLTEWRKVSFSAPQDSANILDLEIRLVATEGPVTFGGTKEAGMCAIRVAQSMNGDHGGTIMNAQGSTGEKETWGVQAPWCDYSGSVQGQTIGITIMDHPDNLRYPTYWHVRDYGLMAANPFGISHFTRDPSQNGTHHIQEGESLIFRYRILVHDGPAALADVAAQYAIWIDPPSVRVEAG